jgi:DNA-binding CsgD family transcriptional regulator
MGKVRTIVNGHELPDPDLLNAREIDVLKWLAEGKRQNEIASLLRVKPKAANQSVTRVLRKLATKTSAGAVAAGLRKGLIT